MLRNINKILKIVIIIMSLHATGLAHSRLQEVFSNTIEVEASEISDIDQRTIIKIYPTEEIEVIKEIEVPTFVYITEEFNRDNVLNYMRMKGLSADEVAIFDKIIELESRWDINARPITNVYHCQNEARGWFAVEVNTNGYQDTCEAHGATQGRIDYSYGLFQILISNAERYECSLDNYQGQVDCAILIYRNEGFGAWTTYYKI